MCLAVDIVVSEEAPDEDSIWLAETRDSVLSPLELCSLESVARHHPNTSVYFLLVTSHLDSQARLRELSRALDNIKVRVSGVRYLARVKTEVSGTSHLPGLHLLSPLTPHKTLELRGSVEQQVASQGLSCPHHLTCFSIK